MTTRLERRLAEQRQNRSQRTLLIVGSLVLMLVVACAAYFMFGGTFGKVKVKRTGAGFSSNKINILVLGVDERNDDVGRSDTIFVVTADTQTNEISMLSVPRDTRVKIPGYGWDKINHAYSEGGQQLSQKAIEDLLGIPIDYYVMINFSGFYKIVDAVGGVAVDVEKRMYYHDPYDNLVIDLQPGLQRMDGQTAIKYVRYRDEEGDIGRVERQQKFIKAMMKEVSSPSVLPRIPAIITEVSRVIKTDMSTSEMISLAKMLNDAYKNGLKTDMVPGKPAFINEISYWLPDIAALRQHVAEIQGIAMDDKYTNEAQRLAIDYERSVPKEMKIIELPKPEQTKPGDKKAVDKTVTSKQTTPAPTKLRVQVLNASGIPEAGDKIAAIMRSKGFEVTGVSKSSSLQKYTVVISNTTNSSVVNQLTGLPFNYALQVTKDDSKANQVTVVVGKDYSSR